MTQDPSILLISKHWQGVAKLPWLAYLEWVRGLPELGA